MKKILSVTVALALLLSMTGCMRAQADDLMIGISPKPKDSSADMEAGAAAIADFGVRLFQASLEDGKNTLISPLSVISALAMTANGANGETLSQMEEVFGMDCEALNGYLLAYRNLLPESKVNKLRLANGIWFKDDPNLEVRQDFLQTNADYYGAGIYRSAFDEGTKSEINSWVKKHTDNMIPEILDQIPQDAIMYLVNALAFEAQWELPYEQYQVHDGVFTLEDGTRRDVQMMHSTEHKFLEDSQATGFVKYYQDREYAFVAMLPKEGVSISEYVQALSGSHLRQMLSEPEDIMVVTTIPKFETQYSVEMSEILQNMGMTDAFDSTAADFTRLGVYNGEGVNICIGRVLHKTFLCVEEQGTKAAAATAVEMLAEGAMEMPEHKTVTLDRPFVYMLIDCRTNLPFFIGTMMDVNG